MGEAEEKKEFNAKEMMIEGCINPEARLEISQMLSRRLAELDPTGIKAKFIMKLRKEVDDLPNCKEMIGDSDGQPST